MRYPVIMILLATAPAAAASAAGQDVFVSTGEHGEPRFSDEAAPGAERIEVPAPAPAESADAMERRIEHMLEVAEALESSRLARERARAEARAARAEAGAKAPEQVVEERYVTAWPWAGHRAPDHRRFPDHRRHRDRDRGDDGRREPSGGDAGEPRQRSRAFLWDDGGRER
ncbi:MAG: DUF4124 domain-containing protein [Pseudomonadota bacterium]